GKLFKGRGGKGLLAILGGAFDIGGLFLFIQICLDKTKLRYILLGATHRMGWRLPYMQYP
ncbi:MAG: hypothetical protein J7M27_14945, partial [Candidatus Latescibacteria bacterium]|nr:hypothetical protein [Candidatus Latescibacterota bacterium]